MADNNADEDFVAAVPVAEPAAVVAVELEAVVAAVHTALLLFAHARAGLLRQCVLYFLWHHLYRRCAVQCRRQPLLLLRERQLTLWGQQLTFLCWGQY